MSSKNPLSYKYKICITSASNILSSGILSEKFRQCNSISIESGAFANFRDCDRSLQKAMNFIGNEELIDGKKPALVIQTNPNLSDEENKPAVAGWPDNVILKSYLVNADDVKNDSKTLMYSIYGSIECDLQI